MKSKTPTKAQRRRMRIVKEIGCIICGSGPAECHHLLSGGVRIGHESTIGLCSAHHTGNGDANAPSYHGNKKLFHAVCGYDLELLIKQNELIEEYESNIIGAPV